MTLHNTLTYTLLICIFRWTIDLNCNDLNKKAGRDVYSLQSHVRGSLQIPKQISLSAKNNAQPPPARKKDNIDGDESDYTSEQHEDSIIPSDSNTNKGDEANPNLGNDEFVIVDEYDDNELGMQMETNEQQEEKEDSDHDQTIGELDLYFSLNRNQNAYIGEHYKSMSSVNVVGNNNMKNMETNSCAGESCKSMSSKLPLDENKNKENNYNFKNEELDKVDMADEYEYYYDDEVDDGYEYFYEDEEEEEEKQNTEQNAVCDLVQDNDDGVNNI